MIAIAIPMMTVTAKRTKIAIGKITLWPVAWPNAGKTKTAKTNIIKIAIIASIIFSTNPILSPTQYFGFDIIETIINHFGRKKYRYQSFEVMFNVRLLYDTRLIFHFDVPEFFCKFIILEDMC